MGPAKPLKHTCQLGEVASYETCNDREIYPFLPVEVHTRDGALRKACYQNIFMISDEKDGTLLVNHEVFLFGFDTDFTHELSKSYFRDSLYESHSHDLGKVRDNKTENCLDPMSCTIISGNGYSRPVEPMLTILRSIH